uniref:Uncharacterized protein n=1 Tax=Leersia perrieri TaxID=77586 RepID=A0A0D9XUD6_9ORYZ
MDAGAETGELDVDHAVSEHGTMTRTSTRLESRVELDGLNRELEPPPPPPPWTGQYAVITQNNDARRFELGVPRPAAARDNQGSIPDPCGEAKLLGPSPNSGGYYITGAPFHRRARPLPPPRVITMAELHLVA